MRNRVIKQYTKQFKEFFSPFISPIINFYRDTVITWPTQNGYTLEQVNETCWTILTSFSVYQQCSDIYDPAQYIESCIEDTRVRHYTICLLCKLCTRSFLYVFLTKVISFKSEKVTISYGLTHLSLVPA